MTRETSVNKKIEILRCISILLVIYIHNASEVKSQSIIPTPGWFESMIHIVSGIIGRTAVPLMFTISGFLFARKYVDFFENLKRKTRSLLVPYILWNTIWMLIYAFALKMGILNDTGKNVLEYGLMDIIDSYTGYLSGAPFVYPLWFLRDLYLLQCVAPIFQKYFNSQIWDLVVLGTGLTYVVGFPTEQIFMFMLGVWLYNHRTKILKTNRNRCMLAFGVFCICAFLELSNIISGSVIRPAGILTGMILLYCFTDVVEHNCSNRLIDIAPYTMFIYCGHQYTLLLIRHICSRVLNQSIWVRTLEYVLIPPFLFLMLLLCGYVMKKYLKPVYLLLSGGR